MIVIKITTPWRHSFFKDQIPTYLKTQYRFEIDNDCKECDYWLVWGGLPSDKLKESVICEKNNIIFMTDEVHDQKHFNKKFLDQFYTVITCRDDLNHSNLYRIHEFNHWHLNKTYEEVYNRERIVKTKMISVVASDLTQLPGHKNRFAFVNKLIGHFKERIDVFGRGFNPIDDKWNALAPYKYSIAVENNKHKGYFTEKITECYIAHTIPVYYGAPDINDYFISESLLSIDITDYRKSIEQIENLLAIDPYLSIEEKIIDAKIKYLEHLNIFSAFIEFIKKNLPLLSILNKNKKVNVIKAEETFISHYFIRKTFRKLKKII